MIRIIDHKRVELTDDEWNLYQEISNSYNKPNFKGSQLFAGLFETDDNGIIIFVRPPVQYTTMEIIVFVMSVMQQQHLRIMRKQVDEEVIHIREEVLKLKEELQKCREGNEP